MSEEPGREFTRLYPAKGSRWFYLSLVVFLFLLFGVPFLVEGGTSNWNTLEKSLAIVLAAFSLGGMACFIIQLLPGSWYLELRPDGFTFCSLYVRHSYLWRDVGPLRVHKDPEMGRVAFDVIGKERSPGVVAWFSRAWSHRECKSDGYIRGTFGMPSQALADLMNKLRDGSVTSWAKI